ncbi:MAG: hypothetical protein JXA42_02405 [Anaerolineales bacterium]|nr:hypothetical protein [Anaerolineales bacterium]
MISEQTIRSFSKKAFGRVIASLGSAVPLGILLELSRSGNLNALCEKADELVLRGSCRLRKLQVAVPQIRIPELKLRLLPENDQLQLLRGKIEQARMQASDELALAQALIELYVGMLLRLFTSQKRSSKTGERLENQSFLTPMAWILSLFPPKSAIKQKRPILN